ncbi:MAG: ATP-binding protein [Chloroflexota bacterium]
MFLWWGAELVQFYNDGYRPSLGVDRHPQALGARGREFWAEIWPAIGPQIEAVMGQGESTWNIDHLVPIARNHRIEEVYWTYGYSPVLDDDGHIGGTLVIVQETTERVVNERRMRLLQTLADRLNAEARRPSDVYRITADVLAQYDADIPFALLYACEEDSQVLRRVAQVGAIDDIGRPEAVDLAAASTEVFGWPLHTVISSERAEHVAQLGDRFGAIPGGRWAEPVQDAMLIPIAAPGQARAAGILIAGLSPRLPPNDGYREFLRFVAGQVGTALANAQAYEREQAGRRQLERLFEQAPAAIALLSGPDHVFTLANPGYLALAGRDDVIGKTIHEVFPELAGQGILERMHQVYTEGEPFFGNELPLHLDRLGGGSLDTIYFNFVYAPMYGPDGAVEGIFVHAYDVTEQVKARQVAEDAKRAQDEFLSIASHELRNPIAGIKGTAQLLRRSQRMGRLTDERLDRYVQSIETGSARLTTLTEDLLDVSRLQRGELPLRVRQTDLAALIQEVIGRLPATERRRVRLTLGSDPLSVSIDPDRVEQILVNLLDNAIKYSPQDGDIRVTLESDAEGSLVRVQDRGIGLPATAAEHIFEPFGRAKNAEAANIPGLGLGLYICRQIAHRHGGKLWAESDGEGQGTTFSLWLPIITPDGMSPNGG